MSEISIQIVEFSECADSLEWLAGEGYRWVLLASNDKGDFDPDCFFTYAEAVANAQELASYYGVAKNSSWQPA